MDQYDDKTPPESLSAMRRAVDVNTRTCENALNWSARTYELVKPVVDRMAESQQESRSASRRSGYAVSFALIAVVASFVGLACEIAR